MPVGMVRLLYKLIRPPIRGGRFRMFVFALRALGFTGEYEVTLAQSGGAKLIARLDSSIEAEILLTGWYEKPESLAIRRSLHPGMVAIDVGANVGAHAMRLASLVGSKGRLFCFEPNPETYQRLLANVQRNAFDQVTAFNCALGHEKGRATLYVNPPSEPNRNANMLVPNKFGLEVETISLDQAWEEMMGRVPIDFMKMDIEGFELPVLQRGSSLLRQRRPVILSEFSPEYGRRLGYAWQDVCRFFEVSRYGLTVLSRRPTDGSVYNYLAEPI